MARYESKSLSKQFISIYKAVGRIYTPKIFILHLFVNNSGWIVTQILNVGYLQFLP